MSQTRGRGSPQRIGDILSSVLREAEDGEPRRQESMEVVACWRQIAGERLGEVSRAVTLTNGKLFLEVGSPVWKQELMFQRRSLVRKINSHLGKKAVADIVINVREYPHG